MGVPGFLLICSSKGGGGQDPSDPPRVHAPVYAYSSCIIEVILLEGLLIHIKFPILYKPILIGINVCVANIISQPRIVGENTLKRTLFPKRTFWLFS